MSAYTALEGTSGFNKTPLSPPGLKLAIHENTYTRRTWAPHGSGGRYIGPAMKHYRCNQVYVNATRAERVGDTV